MVNSNTQNYMPEQNKESGNYRSILIIGSLFFIFGFVTWLNSVLIPYLKIACELNNLESYLVAFSFYISYLVMAIPSARVLKLVGFKKGMSLGLLVMAVGALIFIPAALSRMFGLFLFGLFVQGTGLAVLQTAANPYITILGPRESAAKRISIMGVCNKVAGAIAPIALGAVALKNIDSLVARIHNMPVAEKTLELNELALRVINPYIIITVVLVLLAYLINRSGLPEIDTEHEDETLAATNSNKKSIFQFPQLILGTVAMFFYVGVEVIAGDTVISYGASQGIALSSAKFFATTTLVSMIVGYLIGIATIPKYISQEKALMITTVIGIVFTGVALFTTGFTSVLFISLLGIANALVFPAIWPLAINGLGRFTKIGSSLLIMAIAGGAIIPLIYGFMADKLSPHDAYLIALPCYFFIFFYAKFGHKIR
jgi:FHS family L-fucose permease-like MFS transporter